MMFRVSIHPESRRGEAANLTKTKKIPRFQNPDLAISTMPNLLISNLLYKWGDTADGNLITQMG